MSDLAGRRTHLRSNIRRPAPAGFEDHPSDGRLVEVDHVHPAATEIARVFRSAEVFSLQPWHAGIVPARIGTDLTGGRGRVLPNADLAGHACDDPDLHEETLARHRGLHRGARRPVSREVGTVRTVESVEVGRRA